MSKTTVETDSAPRPAGGYSQAIVAAGQVWVAGQVGSDPATGEPAGPDLETQTRRALANVAAILAAAGAGLGDLVSVTVFLDDMADFDAYDRVYQEIVPAPRPARATVGASIAPFRIEIQATAVLP
jgi:reactive intermediate/imine deaminase